MKLLFIGLHYYNKCGGEVCSKMNLTIIKELFGTANVYEFRVKRKENKDPLRKVGWYLKGFCNDLYMCSIGGYDTIQEKEIFNIIKTNGISTVFIDNSAFGNIIRKIKKHFPKIEVITFFHNVEYLYSIEELSFNKKYFLYYRNYIIKRNEKNACLFSDKIIALNERDAVFINSLYHRRPEMEIPIAMKDTYKYLNDRNKNFIKEKTGLFVGSYFALNIQGLSNFIEEVLPHVDMKLMIVGSGMNHLKKKYGVNDKLEIHDFVENLTEFYEKSHFVVMPIWAGSGMKVKTAEALMYGKYILGTREAFVGYNITPQIGTICEDNEAFIKVINSYQINNNTYNPISRELFLKNHSYEVALDRFRKIFNLSQII